MTVKAELSYLKVKTRLVTRFTLRSILLSIWLILLLVGFAKSSFAATTTSQPTNLTLSLSLPAHAQVGTQYNGTITATAKNLIGCYRWIATDLPAGLSISPAVECSSSGSQIQSTVTGIPSEPSGASFVNKVTISIEAIGISSSSTAKNGPISGTGMASILVIPKQWNTSNAALAYANTGLSMVSCLQGPVCWTVGTSKNSVPAPIATKNSRGSTSNTVSPNISGNPPLYVPFEEPGTKTRLNLIEGGTFIASIQQITPLRLGVVRTAVAMSISSMSCLNISTCVFVGTENLSSSTVIPEVMLMSNGGTAWETKSLSLSKSYTNGNLVSVSCMTSDRCIAIGDAKNTGTGSVSFTLNISIVANKVQLGNVNFIKIKPIQLADLSCANSYSCLTVGRTNNPGVTNSALILATSDGGSTWQIDQHVGADSPNPHKGAGTALQPWMPTVDGPLQFGGLVGVGCSPGSTTSSCEVSWPFWPALANTSNGTNWYSDISSQGTSGSMGGSISCPTTGHCFGVSATQFMCAYDTVCTSTQILETIPNAPNWEVGLAGEGPDPNKYSPSLNSISCPTISECVSVGYWFPEANSSWSPSFPLVMSPQMAIHPFFRPPPPPPTLFTWTNLGIVLGVVSLVTGWGEFADAFGGIATLVTGLLGLGIGAATTSQGDALGWISVGLGALGLYFYTSSLASTVTGIVDYSTGSAGPAPNIVLPKQLQDVPTPKSTGEGSVNTIPPKDQNE